MEGNWDSETMDVYGGDEKEGNQLEDQLQCVGY